MPVSPAASPLRVNKKARRMRRHHSQRVRRVAAITVLLILLTGTCLHFMWRAFYRANCIDGYGLLYSDGRLPCDSPDDQDAVLRLDVLLFLVLVSLLYWLFYEQAKSNLRLKRKP